MERTNIELTTEQKSAINAVNMSVAVSAAAGSGKTTMMTQRIIKRVCEPDGDISRILAVTYTKAAAAQLSSKIAEALSLELAKDPSNAHIARQSLLVSSARISTVHRFCLDVIHDNFDAISLPSDFTPGDELLLSAIEKDVGEQLIEDYFDGKITGDDAIDDFGLFVDTFGSVKDTDELLVTLTKLYDSLAQKLEFLDYLDVGIAEYDLLAESEFSESAMCRELYEYVLSFLSHYKRIIADAKAYIESTPVYNGSPKAKQRFNLDLAFIDEFSDMMTRGARYEDASRTISEFCAGFKINKFIFEKNLVYDAEMEYFKSQRTDFKDGAKEIAEYFNYREDDIKDAAKATGVQLRALKKFLTVFDKRFAAEKARRHIVSFSDMEHLALKILWDKEHDKPTPAAERLRDSLDEVYVDEFQDTNEIQNKIFSLVSREDNEFCVGDIKQCIYLYRGAAPYIFERMLSERAQYAEGTTDKKTKIFLTKNFRSSVEIVDFCNAVFEKSMNFGGMHYGDEEKLIAWKGKKCGDVEVCITSSAADDPEAEFVAKRILMLLGEGRKPSDIAILVRKNKQIKQYSEKLEKYGIPCRVSSDKNFFLTEEVLLAISVLNAIDNPARDIYLAAALKSPIFTFSLDDLIRIRRSAKGSLFDALCEYTEKTGFEKGKRFLSFLDKMRTLSQSVPCDELIRQMYTECGIFAFVGVKDGDAFSRERARANLIRLYDRARSFCGGAYRDLYDFLSFINKAIDSGKEIDLSGFKSTDDAVSVMSVHKSKGLEFPVCFMCGTGNNIISSNDNEGKRLSSHGVPLKIIHPSRLGKVETPQHELTKLLEKKEMMNEELRILYVALTRAKEKLIVTAKGPVGIPDSSRIDKYFSEYSIYSKKSFIDIILSCIAGKDVCKFVTDDIETAEIVTPPADDEKAMTFEEAKELVRERMSYEYPTPELTRMPSKMAVSQLYPDLLDEDEEKLSSDESFDLVPRFLSDDDGKPSAAERGTATHLFMQFFDFDRVEKNGIEAEIDYLAAHRFIYPDDAKKIDVRAIKVFFESKIAEKMKKADKIWREKRFISAFEAEDFTSDEELKKKVAGEKILVQGVIDCAFADDDGKIVLVDYKTDHFVKGTPRDEIERTLRERHTRQLTYYKRACQTLFGEVKSVFVYSFALGDTVEIFTEDMI